MGRGSERAIIACAAFARPPGSTLNHELADNETRLDQAERPSPHRQSSEGSVCGADTGWFLRSGESSGQTPLDWS